MRARFYADRHRRQAGTTLVELLVSLTIASLALALIVGTLSTGLLDATLAKRNTAAQTILQYEMEQISASPYNPLATPYSNCFAMERPASPTTATGGYLGTCPAGYALRSDVSCQQPCSSAVQNWNIVVSALPSGTPTGASVQLYKVTHQ
jgi:type II secretory pathway pseudopilin PulG